MNRGKVLEILIVEDDEKLNNGIRLALKNESYTFSQCRTLKDAREVLRTRKVADRKSVV